MANSVSFDAVRANGETVLVTVTSLSGGKGQIVLDTWAKGLVVKPPATSHQTYTIERIRGSADGSTVTAVHRIVIVEFPIRIVFDHADPAATLFVGKDDKTGERFALSPDEIARIDSFIADAKLQVAAK